MFTLEEFVLVRLGKWIGVRGRWWADGGDGCNLRFSSWSVRIYVAKINDGFSFVCCVVVKDGPAVSLGGDLIRVFY